MTAGVQVRDAAVSVRVRVLPRVATGDVGGGVVAAGALGDVVDDGERGGGEGVWAEAESPARRGAESALVFDVLDLVAPTVAALPRGCHRGRLGNGQGVRVSR